MTGKKENKRSETNVHLVRGAHRILLSVAPCTPQAKERQAQAEREVREGIG